MSENIKLNKTVFNKSQYSKTIDNSFSQLGVKTISEGLAAQPTTNDFFSQYNDLFYDIPEYGTNNSHEYLIKTSSEYINFEANQEEIIALQAEITQLRVDLLEAQKQVIELETGTSLNEN